METTRYVVMWLSIFPIRISTDDWIVWNVGRIAVAQFQVNCFYAPHTPVYTQSQQKISKLGL